MVGDDDSDEALGEEWQTAVLAAKESLAVNAVDDDASSAASLSDLAATLELAVKEIRLLEATAGGNRTLEQKLAAANGTSQSKSASSV